jgi:hypothetical protein
MQVLDLKISFHESRLDSAFSRKHDLEASAFQLEQQGLMSLLENFLLAIFGV